MSLVGDFGAELLRSTRINRGFFGARGLSLDRGLVDLNPDEVGIKQEMAEACDHVVGILDSTKWHRSALLPFVATDRIDAIITDADAPAEDVEAWRGAGVDVLTAEARASRRPPAAARDLRRVVPGPGTAA
jgi:DeoR family transcriptional regulator of aga operon/DeoR family fructose operon transcriptional repressor